MNESYSLDRIKRRWCPEWLWWVACNPVPFWNELFPAYRIFLRPLTWTLSQKVLYDDEGVPKENWIRERLGGTA